MSFSDEIKSWISGWNQVLEKSELTKAIESRNLEEIKRLIENGCEIDAVDESGRTALMLAASLPENHDVVVALVEAGANPLLQDKEGRTVLDYVFEPEEPPEHHENAYEAWIHCEEHYTKSYLYQIIQEAKENSGSG